VLSLTLAQVAPVLPYLLLVVMLIVRPKGPARHARPEWLLAISITSARFRALAHLGHHRARVHRRAGAVLHGLFADADVADGHHDHLRAVYNMLLGQSGMLSFGHAVYSGSARSSRSMHAGDRRGTFLWPVALLPLIGGLAGAFFGVVFGYLTTKKAGTPFAMITLGIGEMVFAAALMFPGFFGGEGGITADRTAGPPLAGIPGLDFGPQIQVYYLIAAWCYVCIVAMFALTATPLGRIANAVRDNPERAEFIGYNTQRVRWFMLILSSFFAGIAGGLSALNFEIVSAENVSTVRSGGVLLAAFIGGAAFFFGPILGAIVFIFFAVALSEYTNAWQLYLGIFFVLLVMYAPGGLASLVMMNLRVLSSASSRACEFRIFGVLATAALAFGTCC
jgi:branched-chain amino acid transport system permease protein